MKVLFKLVAGLLLATTAQAAAPRTIEMKVNGLVCAFCAQGIEKKLRKLDATADVYVNLESKLVAVALKDGQDIGDEALKALLTHAGYALKEITRSERTLESLREAAPP